MKNFYVALLIIATIPQCLCTALSAQTNPPPKQWDKGFGGNDRDELYALQQTADGGYIMGGNSLSGISGEKSEQSRGGFDYWIIKMDVTGVQQWDKSFGGAAADEFSTLQQTNDGGYIAGGSSSSGLTGDKSQSSRGYKDYWIVKMDSHGVKQWDKRFGGASFDYLTCIQQTMDGGYILGGYSSSGIGGDKTQNNWGVSYDYWVVKINYKGIKEWDKRFGGTDDDYLTSLRQTADGSYMLGGYTMSGSTGNKTEDSRGKYDYWVVKIDADGIKKWDKRFGGTDDDFLTCLQRTTDGGYMLAGHSISAAGGDKTQPGRGAYDYWIVKMDSSGVKQWDKRFGGTNFDYCHALELTTGGGYILGGTSYSGMGGDKTEDTRGGSDYWIVNIDAEGIQQWDKRLGGSQSDYLYALQQTANGNYIAGGWSYSAADGDKTGTDRGNADYWIIKLGCPPGAVIAAEGNLDICIAGTVKLSVQSTDTLQYQWLRNAVKITGATKRNYIADAPGNYKVMAYTSNDCRQLSNTLKVTNSCIKIANSLSVAPNPSQGFIRVIYQSNTTANIQLNVLDKTGKILFTKIAEAIQGNNTYQLNLNLFNGIYNLQVNNGREQSQVKIIIEK